MGCTVGGFDDAEMGYDRYFLPGIAGCGFPDGIDCAVMELPGTFGFPFPIGEKMVRVCRIPGLVGFRIGFPDLSVFHAFADAIAAFPE